MRWFDNLSTSLKIGSLSVVLIVALGYASFEAYQGFSNWATYSGVVRDNRLPTIQALGALNTERMAIRAQTVEVLVQHEAVTDKTALQNIQSQRRTSWEVVDRYWQTLDETPRLTEDGQRLMDNLTREYRAWREIYVDLDRLIAQMIETRGSADFNRLMDDYRATISRMVPISNRMGDAFDALTEANMQRARTQAETNVSMAESETFKLLLFAALALIIAVALALLTLFSLVRPLRALVQNFAVIGEGNYDQVIETGRKDEVGLALAALSHMQAKLKADITETKRVAAENLRVRFGLDSVSASVMIADTQHNIIYVNDAGMKLFRRRGNEIRRDLPGFDAERLVGGNIDSFHKNPAHQRGMIENLRGAHRTEIKVGGLTLQLVTSPIVDASGERLGTVVEWTDRTEELKVMAEVTDLVDGAVQGDFTKRIHTDGLDGFFLRLGEGVNRLVERTATGLAEVARVLKAVARGDLTDRVAGEYQGTFGELKEDTNNTANRLQELIGQIKESVEAINTAAREIASGNADLSQRTEEQASSLEETASSMEELTSTVKQNADNARQANQLSNRAQDVAMEGGKQAHAAMDSMKAITESSGKISEIITVIDGIAFQTNILALNAAVEAARAGEQGRGFAVVAGEVRNLAQRSASAAKEIKTLISESLHTVDAGSKLVVQAGETMEEIVTQVKRVSDLIAEISAASDEQTSGIEQVNTAITQMDDVTQQNASLVEEAAAAAESLEEQAKGLSTAVSVFKIEQNQAARLGAPAPALPAAAPRKAIPAAPRPAAAARPAAARPAAKPAARPASKPEAKPTAKPSVVKKGGGDDEWEEF